MVIQLLLSWTPFADGARRSYAARVPDTIDLAVRNGSSVVVALEDLSVVIEPAAYVPGVAHLP
jgi:hypothetical protein